LKNNFYPNAIKLACLYLIIIFNFTFAQEADKNLTDYVNPFIGTANGGNTFPGAVVPWGMISISPHNAPNSPSGYISGEKYFYGVGCTHLSGTGCPDFGSVIISAFSGEVTTDREKYKTTYEGEKASPGYYSLYLSQYKIKAEVTTAVRSGIIRFFFWNKNSVNISVDVGRNLSIVGGGCIRKISDHEIAGYNISGGFCGENNRQRTYFFISFNMPFNSGRIWINDKFIPVSSKSTVDTSIGYVMKFNPSPGKPLLAKIGISYVSMQNAKQNLETEIPSWDFEGIKEKAQKLWEENLSRIIVTGNENDKIKFYTALYHILIHPNIISDENGEYPLMGRNGIGKYKDRNRYSVFSLCDTYRTLNPFLTLVYPEKESEIIKTMLDMYKENGYLPKWELAGNETYLMVGDPAALVIADSYLKGIKDFDVNLAFKALLKPALLNKDENAPPVRAGYHQLVKYGYIPFEQDTTEDWWVWGPVSTTLEYCYADWAISQFAKGLGDENYYYLFYMRAHFYKNLFDSSDLFMRPKLKNGNWLTPFNSLASEGSGNWGGSGGPGFVEGNAWNYTWFVPYDISGLIRLFGGNKIFTDKLSEDFSNQYFSMNNEPDIAYPYLFTYVKGEESLTREIIPKIIDKDFSTGADGLPGNDDCGTISGWLVFSSLGFYPACIASNEYRIGVPLFDKAVIKLNRNYYQGDKIIIQKYRDDFKSPTFNKEKLNYYINHNELVKGGELIFK
jgi:predicted alpha-1,2-mannosidase